MEVVVDASVIDVVIVVVVVVVELVKASLEVLA